MVCGKYQSGSERPQGLLEEQWWWGGSVLRTIIASAFSLTTLFSLLLFIKGFMFTMHQKERGSSGHGGDLLGGFLVPLHGFFAESRYFRFAYHSLGSRARMNSSVIMSITWPCDGVGSDMNELLVFES